jgi:hypothetical protein
VPAPPRPPPAAPCHGQPPPHRDGTGLRARQGCRRGPLQHVWSCPSMPPIKDWRFPFKLPKRSLISNRIVSGTWSASAAARPGDLHRPRGACSPSLSLAYIRCVWSFLDLPLTKDWRFPPKLSKRVLVISKRSVDLSHLRACVARGGVGGALRRDAQSGVLRAQADAGDQLEPAASRGGHGAVEPPR